MYKTYLIVDCSDEIELDVLAEEEHGNDTAAWRSAVSLTHDYEIPIEDIRIFVEVKKDKHLRSTARS